MKSADLLVYILGDEFLFSIAMWTLEGTFSHICGSDNVKLSTK